MKVWVWAVFTASMLVAVAQAQVENPDFWIRAKFRDSADESVGNATVKVKSRFLQQYYGGVTRLDEYRFQLEIDSLQYANKSIDVKVDDFFVGTHAINSSGFLDVTYRSDFKPEDAPDLPLPANFPDPNDRATQESEFSLELRARDRERKLIKKIDEALKEIESGSYGFCESCGIEIGIRRLEARPTATLCIDCKTLDEIREKQMG